MSRGKASTRSTTPPPRHLPGEELSMWAIYDHPADYPKAYVARRWSVVNTERIATEDLILAGDLEGLRHQMQGMALTRVTRSPGDAPEIIEVWL